MGVAIGALRWPTRVAWGAVVAGLVIALLATTARQNGVTAVWPIMIALAAAGIRLSAIRSRRMRALAHRRLLAVAIGTVPTVGAFGVMLAGTSAVTRVHEYPELYTQLWDLGYMSLERDEWMIPVLPERMQPAQTLEEVRERRRAVDALYVRFDPAATQGSRSTRLRPRRR